MKTWHDAACVEKVNGKACGLPSKRHAIQRRFKTDLPVIGHGFVFAQGAVTNPKNSRSE